MTSGEATAMAPLDDEGTARLDETALDSHSNGGTDTPKLTETASRSISPGASALLASTSPVHHRVHDDRSGGGGSPEETAELPQHTQEMLAKLNARIADLSGQVTSLNGKLVQSYNRVGGLEDDLHARTAETGTLRRDVEKLEGQRKEWEDKYEGGLLVEKDHVQQELTRMMDQVIQETASRGKAVSDKEQIEKELEQLSSQLFQEANTMVAVERMARLRSEKKMEQLEQNLKDTEAMMAGQGEQMRGLGSKLEELEKERDELRHQMDDLANTSTISIVSEPESMAGTSFASSSGFPSSFSPEQPLPSTALVPSTPGGPYPRPTANIPHPLQYLSLDCQPYFEFVVFTKGMARIRRNIMNRPVGQRDGGEVHFGSGISGYAAAYGQAMTPGGQHVSTSENKYYAQLAKQEQAEALSEALPLSQYSTFPFIKRIVDEDTSQTLHLDDAPGLSIFNRGKISTAIIEGNLDIEPAYISLPSENCCLCNASLQRYIASHQQMAAREDPRKKLTRLATGWIPGNSGSGANTPSKEGSSGFSMSTLTSALEALTPAKELAGFNFGMSSSSSSGQPERKPSTGGAAPVRRPSSMQSAVPGSSGGEKQGDFPLIAAAKHNAQVYLFRVIGSDTKFAVCPTYCLPRLRAVCDLWTYVRVIQRGLLSEDAPRFVMPAVTSEYGIYTRRIASQVVPASATSAVGPGLSTPLATPLPSANKQLSPSNVTENGDGSASAAVSNGNGGASENAGLGLDIGKKDFTFESSNPSIESLASSQGGTSTVQSATTAPTSVSTSTESLGKPAAEEAVSTDSAPGSTTGSRRPSVELTAPTEDTNTPTSEAKPFNLVFPPSRPKRNVTRPAGGSAPGTPVAGTPTIEQKDSFAVPAPPKPKMNTESSTSLAVSSFPASATSSQPLRAPQLPPRMPSSNLNPRSAPPDSAPRLPPRPAFNQTGSLSHITTANQSGSAISTKQLGWQENCWHEVVRLKEAAFWTRVGSQYHQH